MATREVSALSWANVLSRPKPTMVRSAETTTCAQTTPNGSLALRLLSFANANMHRVPLAYPSTRNVHGVTSASATIITGQLKPQARLNRTSSSLALPARSEPCGGTSDTRTFPYCVGGKFGSAPEQREADIACAAAFGDVA